MPVFEFGGEGAPIVRKGQTQVIHKNGVNILQATLTADETLFTGDIVRYYLQVDGTNFEEVTAETLHTFTNTGQELKDRIVFIGVGGSSTYIENLKVVVVEGT